MTLIHRVFVLTWSFTALCTEHMNKHKSPVSTCEDTFYLRGPKTIGDWPHESGWGTFWMGQAGFTYLDDLLMHPLCLPKTPRATTSQILAHSYMKV